MPEDRPHQLIDRLSSAGYWSKVSVGQAVQAMALNGPGFVGRALYQMPEFYRTKPVDLLIEKHIKADDLKSDSLGKTLDYLWKTGITEVFVAVTAHALGIYDITLDSLHGDTASICIELYTKKAKFSWNATCPSIHHPL